METLRSTLPIIDNLASNGMVFNNAFVSSSICSPSRYSILTGKYAGRSEGTSFINNFPLGNLSRIANNIELEENKTNVPKQLQNAGYKTAFIGKSHIIDHNVLETYTEAIMVLWLIQKQQILTHLQFLML